MTITIGESYELQTKFHWYGTLDFAGSKMALNYSGGILFFSKDSSDLRRAKLLQEKFSDTFTDFYFYKEEGVDKVMFQTLPKTKLHINL